jgi:P pilus assembly chaperone PapD
MGKSIKWSKEIQSGMPRANANQLPNQASLPLFWQPASSQQPEHAHCGHSEEEEVKQQRIKRFQFNQPASFHFSISFCEVIDR